MRVDQLGKSIFLELLFKWRLSVGWFYTGFQHFQKQKRPAMVKKLYQKCSAISPGPF